MQSSNVQLKLNYIYEDKKTYAMIGNLKLQFLEQAKILFALFTWTYIHYFEQKKLHEHQFENYSI